MMNKEHSMLLIWPQIKNLFVVKAKKVKANNNASI